MLIQVFYIPLAIVSFRFDVQGDDASTFNDYEVTSFFQIFFILGRRYHVCGIWSDWCHQWVTDVDVTRDLRIATTRNH